MPWERIARFGRSRAARECLVFRQDSPSDDVGKVGSRKAVSVVDSARAEDIEFNDLAANQVDAGDANAVFPQQLSRMEHGPSLLLVKFQAMGRTSGMQVGTKVAVGRMPRDARGRPR